ncbi:E3 ubiquitin-protein ligase RFI2 isoform X1 [Morus notabilis]|uniref:E3 ubiquitin-protein ligase RFI2 isoform X1 n=1 Tax=Morus notabilis TaxID=981085 RepID=UPI000CED4387|nr:E3 ubiquitin-protein ligase RFI2 isoform X1 [Morus notabilis]
MDDDHQPSSGDVSCSICLDLVTDNRGRSRAKLQCGHEFHLDCIGSAFNMKGAMQCPNCRKVENGQWLYANGSTRSFPEFTIDDWIPDEDPYDMGYAEMPFRFHWCPFGEAAQIHSSFEEVESPSNTFPFVADHDLREHHSMFAEQIAASSVPHSYVAYFRPIPPVSSRSINIIDDPNLTNPWNGLRGPNETLNHHIFPAISIQYQSWAPHSSPFSPSSSHVNNVNPASNQSATVRSTRGESNAVVRSRARLFRLVQGSDPRAESSFVASFVPHSPDGTARTHERIQAFHHHQQHSISPGVPSPTVPSFRRFDGPATVPAPPPHDHNAGFYVFPPPGSSDRNTHEAEHPMASHFHGWGREQLPHFPAVFPERDSSWGSSHHPTGSSDSGNRSSSLWHRSWS